MFWAHFHDLCVQKRSCLPWSSDAFWKFSACKFYRKGSGRYSAICESKNEVVCYEVETNFGSFRLSSFIKNVLGAFSRLMLPKMKLFALEFRRILEVFCLRVLQKKFWAQFHDLFVHERSCLAWNSDAFWKFLPCKLYKQSSGSVFSIYESKRKLFAVEFRRILEVLCLQGLQKKFWAQFHDLCVQKWSGLLCNSDAFWKFLSCKLYKQSSGRIFSIYASKNEAVCRGIQTNSGSSLGAS